ncbi:nucleotidyl transferase AbiEii/AbiGii toxin family protein [Sulfurimonas sp. MAG313]|nr:nucleotidyl transferase AbiEii/AbiGii toxin family protein [Sulfurimonas sp. MAG313]MDF1880646.1 nucleotidyl transferase AbiEii/AbiGii toxin family protein [Sulfurimonas sp. MAG313]
MTANVIKALDKIKNNSIFNQALYFTGGTALSYFINHRVSEDIDIVSAQTLKYREIISAMTELGAVKIQDENVTALRMAGLFPDEYMLKFILDDVKIDFFQANRPIQKKILKDSSYTQYQDTTLKILNVKSIAKLKFVALLQRDKLRDLYDFGAILEQGILSIEDIIFISKELHNITSLNGLISHLEIKTESLDDESVYLTETHRVDLSFNDIKDSLLKKVKRLI